MPGTDVLSPLLILKYPLWIRKIPLQAPSALTKYQPQTRSHFTKKKKKKVHPPSKKNPPVVIDRHTRRRAPSPRRSPNGARACHPSYAQDHQIHVHGNGPSCLTRAFSRATMAASSAWCSNVKEKEKKDLRLTYSVTATIAQGLLAAFD